ncbi:MAG: response regulator, partial [Candidatus Omnitrophica bacterium]|nr:response regulator [Candidatus Omnitrophota bacterium]
MESPFKILIVDDHPANRALLSEILKHSHPEYIVFEAEDGLQALEVTREIHPDLILLDIMMPGMDGFEVLKTLKEDERFKPVPVLLITALDNIENKIKGFQAGANDYIAKPIHKEETLARVEAQLRIKRYHDDLQEAMNKLKTAQKALIESA